MEILSDDALWHISDYLSLKDLWSFIQVNKRINVVCQYRYQKEKQKRNLVQKFLIQIVEKTKFRELELVFKSGLETFRLKTGRDNNQFQSYYIRISHTTLYPDESLVISYVDYSPCLKSEGSTANKLPKADTMTESKTGKTEEDKIITLTKSSEGLTGHTVNPDYFKVKTLKPQRVYYHLRFKDLAVKDEDFHSKVTFILYHLFSNNFQLTDNLNFFDSSNHEDN